MTLVHLVMGTGKYGTEVSSQIFYGVVLAYERLKPLEPLFEIHANSTLDGKGSETLLNVGGRYTVNPHLNIIAAIGHTVTSTSASLSELDVYLGLQLEL